MDILVISVISMDISDMEKYNFGFFGYNRVISKKIVKYPKTPNLTLPSSQTDTFYPLHGEGTTKMFWCSQRKVVEGR